MGIAPGGDGVSASREHLVFAYYVTGHGFGHATRVVEVLLDCGAVQADALTVDRLASLEKVSDVVPVACRAAVDAGIRSVCVTNFR
ncbi:hypothetical protein GW17_00024821 [Ensete ventricosum]|nr:hypothetical protein GW17_00024821 [Ensete ventricosum]